MLAALTVMSLMWWVYWWMLRDVRPPRVATTVAAPQQPTPRATTALGLEDDPDQWCVGRSAWTAVDELQLLRLLTDSAPVNPPSTTTSIDNSIPQFKQKDAP